MACTPQRQTTQVPVPVWKPNRWLLLLLPLFFLTGVLAFPAFEKRPALPHSLEYQTGAMLQGADEYPDTQSSVRPDPVQLWRLAEQTSHPQRDFSRRHPWAPLRLQPSPGLTISLETLPRSNYVPTIHILNITSQIFPGRASPRV